MITKRLGWTYCSMVMILSRLGCFFTLDQLESVCTPRPNLNRTPRPGISPPKVIMNTT